MFSEKNVEEYGDTPFQHGCDVAKLDHPMPGGEEGRFAPESNDDQEGGLPGVMASLDIDAANWQWWGGALSSSLTTGVPS